MQASRATPTPRRRRGRRPDQHHDPGEADGEARDLGPGHPLARHEEMRQRQHQQRHHRHRDAGESRGHLLLRPAQEREGQRVRKDAHADAMQPDPPPARSVGRRQPRAGRESQRHRITAAMPMRPAAIDSGPKPRAPEPRRGTSRPRSARAARGRARPAATGQGGAGRHPPGMPNPASMPRDRASAAQRRNAPVAADATPLGSEPRIEYPGGGHDPDEGERGGLSNLALTTELAMSHPQAAVVAAPAKPTDQARASRVLLGSLRQAPGLDRRGGRRARLPRPLAPRREAEGAAQGRDRPHRAPSRRAGRLPRRHRPGFRHRRLRDGDVVDARARGPSTCWSGRASARAGRPTPPSS